MAIWRFVNLNFEEAQPLADLTGVEEDLKATVEICNVLLRELPGRPPNIRILDALTSAALVRYARAFKSGVRIRLPFSLLDGLSEEQARDSYHRRHSLPELPGQIDTSITGHVDPLMSFLEIS